MVVQKALLKTYGSKTMCPKWHFDQVGCEARIQKGGFLEWFFFNKEDHGGI